MSRCHRTPTPLESREAIGARLVLPGALVVAMATSAALLHQPDLIFPEGAALSYGICVQHTPAWSASRWRIAILPPLCAVVGHLLARAHEPRWVLEITGVSVALLLLGVMRSRLAPSLSAAVLPIVFGVHSWAYPVVVLLTCLAIVAGLGFGSASPAVTSHRSWPLGCMTRGWIAICGWIVIAGPLFSLPVAAVSPPVFVSALEWLNVDHRTVDAGIRRCVLLLSAGILGSVASMLAPAEWIAAPSALLLTMLTMWMIGCRHGPALAIALIPGIAGNLGFASFTCGIAIGVGALYVCTSAMPRSLSTAALVYGPTPEERR